MYFLKVFALAMESLASIFVLSFLYVTAKSSQIVSNDINNEMVKTIVVDHSGHGNFKTIQSAIDSIPSGNDRWIKVSIREGIYNEKILIRKDKPKIQLEGNKASETIIQYNDGGDAISSATFRLYAEFFVAINITFKNTYNQEKQMTPYGEIKVAPAIILGADKAAFYGCGFFSIQDTIGDLVGRHYFQHCKIKGSIDFIWGGGQSIYQNCVIEVLGVVSSSSEQEKENGGMLAGFITAQGRESEHDTSGFVFNGCSIVGVGKAYLGRAYRGYSRVVFCNTHMADVIVPQGWNAWSTYPGQVDKLTYAEVNCDGPGAKKEGRVGWEKNLSSEEVSYFTNLKTFVDEDGWMETLPLPPPSPAFSFYSDSNEKSFG